MGAALAVLDEVGIDNVAGHIRAWLDELAKVLASAGLDPGPDPGVRKGILTFRPPSGTAEELVTRARQAGIVLSPRRGRVRVSPHFYNGTAELTALVDLVRAG
jgi:selenocysteine lyase/cysteine desulfurase